LPSQSLRASVLKGFLEDMKPVLQDLRSLIHQWNKDCKSVVKQIRFVFIYTSEMKTLQEEVGSLYKRIQGLLNLLSNGDTRVLRSKAEAERIRQEKERKMDTRAREKHEAEMRNLLQQILNDKGEDEISAAATSSDTSSWEQLEKELEAKGLPQAQVKQLMGPIKEISRTAASPTRMHLPLQPKKPTEPPQPNAKSPVGNLSPHGGRFRSGSRSPSPQPRFGDGSGTSKEAGYRPPPATILVVDRTNGSKQAQSPILHKFNITSS
jgi:hypothetical protein